MSRLIARVPAYGRCRPRAGRSLWRALGTFRAVLGGRKPWRIERAARGRISTAALAALIMVPVFTPGRAEAVGPGDRIERREQFQREVRRHLRAKLEACRRLAVR